MESSEESEVGEAALGELAMWLASTQSSHSVRHILMPRNRPRRLPRIAHLPAFLFQITTRKKATCLQGCILPRSYYYVLRQIPIIHNPHITPHLPTLTNQIVLRFCKGI